MKNPFNTSLSNHDEVLCSLCEDTLLRHIRQSRVFWYCPSCRQEMVCNEQVSCSSAIATPLSQVTQRHQFAKALEHSHSVSVRTR